MRPCNRARWSNDTFELRSPPFDGAPTARRRDGQHRPAARGNRSRGALASVATGPATPTPCQARTPPCLEALGARAPRYIAQSNFRPLAGSRRCGRATSSALLHGPSGRLPCLSAQLCALSGPILSVPFSRCAGGVEGLGLAGGGGAHVAEELALRGGLFGPAQDAAAAPVRRPERRLRASRAPRREALFGPRHRCLCEKNPVLWRVRVSEFVSPHARDGSLSYTGAWDVCRRLFLWVLSYVKM